MVPPVQEPEPKVDEVVVLEETRLAPEVHEPEVKSYGANVVVQEPETKGGNVVAKDPLRCLSREAVDVRTTEEVVRGPAVAVAALGQRVTWWNCCGLFYVFFGSGRWFSV